jgi:hypothetical protein
MKLKVCRQIFEKYTDTKFHENFTKWEVVVQSGKKTDRQRDGRKDGQVDMTRPGDDFCNFASAAARESAEMGSCSNFADGTWKLGIQKL